MKFTEALQLIDNDKKLMFSKYNNGNEIVMVFEKGQIQFVDKFANYLNSVITGSDLKAEWYLKEKPKPKYAFWEIIKMMSEDPSRKFKRRIIEHDGFCIACYPQRNHKYPSIVEFCANDFDGEWEEVE